MLMLAILNEMIPINIFNIILLFFDVIINSLDDIVGFLLVLLEVYILKIDVCLNWR